MFQRTCADGPKTSSFCLSARWTDVGSAGPAIAGTGMLCFDGRPGQCLAHRGSVIMLQESASEGAFEPGRSDPESSTVSPGRFNRSTDGHAVAADRPFGCTPVGCIAPTCRRPLFFVMPRVICPCLGEMPRSLRSPAFFLYTTRGCYCPLAVRRMRASAPAGARAGRGGDRKLERSGRPARRSPAHLRKLDIFVARPLESGCA